MPNPRCDNKDCAACQFNDMLKTHECVALDKCLLENGYCPFFRDHVTAYAEKENARKRAESYGLLATDGTYRQQRFIHAKRVPDRHGIPQIVVEADIQKWLEDLAWKKTIPMDVYSRYMAANPE